MKQIESREMEDLLTMLASKAVDIQCGSVVWGSALQSWL